MKQKILVTGTAGYIGSVLTRLLLDDQYPVRGIDKLNFGFESIQDIYNNDNYEFILGDIRDKDQIREALDGIYGVIHLAAIVGDPACAQNPKLAEETNWEASKFLFDSCVETKSVKRFIFASTCSNYGKMNGEEYLNENSALRPVSLYAQLKVKFENYILNNKGREDFSPTSLRFSTVYGKSPRLRFDLTVNEFIRDAAINNELVIYGEKFWRPYCHVEDLARACKLVLESDFSKVKNQVYGVGETSENYQKEMIANEILKLLPDTKITYVAKKEDPRNYKVDFSKIKEKLSFAITKTVPNGLSEIKNLLLENKIKDPFSKKYSNVV